MTANQLGPGSDIFPCLRYDEPRVALELLEKAFGFRPGEIVVDAEGGVAHAELGVGAGCVMVGGTSDDEWTYRVPRRAGGANTGAAYVAVDDVDALFERARAAGAQVDREPADTDYGSRDFSARDSEGNLWHFGTYRPLVAAASATDDRSPVLYAGMRYDDARAAIRFLTSAFGFSEHFLVPGEGDTVAHAQLAFGTSILMLGSARDDEYQMTTPRRLGGYTQTLTAFVDDPDAHCARARSNGAEIVSEPEDTYGVRIYTARDPEGYVWTFGNYRPAVAVP